MSTFEGVGRWLPSRDLRDLAARLAASWSLRIVGIYIGARLVSWGLILVTMHFATPGVIGSGRDLLEVLASWDGDWYRRIAVYGYPMELPVIRGVVQWNAWAFLPLYPFLVKGLAFGSSALWPVAAVSFSTLCGAVATLLVAKLVRPHGGDRAALVAATLFAIGPSSFILGSAYAESMGLALLFALLCLVDRHRYVAASVVAVPLAFTRPGMQAVALLVLLHLGARLLRWRRSGEVLQGKETIAGGILLAIVGGLGFIWPLVVDGVTGSPDAYIRTELAWRLYADLPGDRIVYFYPWIRGAIVAFGNPAGVIILANVLFVSIAVLFLKPVRRLGRTAVQWYVSWWLYLLAVFFPQSSTIRLCLPMAPVAGGFARLRNWQLAIVFLLALSAQAVLIWSSYGAPFTPLSPP